MSVKAAALLAILLFCGASRPASAAAISTPAVRAASAALERLAPQAAPHVVFTQETAGANGPDSFTVSRAGDRIAISGTSPVAMLSGFRWYLENVAHGQIAREGVNLPKTYPLPRTMVHRTTPYRYRYAYNFTVFGYTAPYWNWQQWQHELDMLALHGINLALMTVGQEAVWEDTFRDFGYTGDEIRNWIVLPAHQPWEWMSNMHSYGGPIAQDTIDRRARLGQRILGRMRELGMEPVLPGFSGAVPDRFAQRNPGAHVVPQGDWSGLARPDWLATDSSVYARVAADFYKHQTARFGLVHAKAIDLLHEGGNAGGVDLTAAGRGVDRALAASDSQYLWVMQGWGANPRKSIVDGIDKQHLLIIDLQGFNWRKQDAFWGVTWLRGFLSNMGGRVNLYGDLADIAKLPEVKADSASKNLAGSAQMDESFARNPVVAELSADLTWSDRPVNVNDWLSSFVTARYGRTDSDALSAWRSLAASVYSVWDKESWGGNDSLFNALPDLDVASGAYGNPHVDYDRNILVAAWKDLLRAGARLRGSDTYRYDLVTVTQQVIANHTRVLLGQIKAAYAAKDLSAFDRLTNRWFALMNADDALLGTRREFLLGSWIAPARAFARTPEERKQFEWDVRSLITVWGPRNADSLQDYANRSYSGLVSSYYEPRWKTYFAALRTSLVTGKPPAKIDWWAFGNAWDRGTAQFPTKPSGDSLQAALAVEKLLSE